tara:strand:+ start:947 stop:1582 length:636 start_codon:yes stop_codon:yes gene_type:complete
MSRDLDPSTVTAISQDVVQPFFAVELLFDGSQTLRMWTGQGTLVLDNGTQWVGTGNLLDISSIGETAEMAVKGATLTLSGIPSEVISLALTQAYQGRVCNIYFGTFSASGSLLKETSDYILLQDGSRINVETGEKGFNQLFSGYMDQMNIDDGPETSTIELKVENKLIDLERARVARYTSGYQKSVYPNDSGLDFIEDLQDKQIPWGRKVD